MNLQTLKEQKRVYNHLTPITEYIDKNFADVKDQFTNDIFAELVNEIQREDKKSLAIVKENRLYRPNKSVYYTGAINKTKEKLPLAVYSSDWYSITGADTDERIYQEVVTIDQLFIVENEIVFVEAEITYKKEQAEAIRKRYEESLASNEKQVKEAEELIADMKKFNLTTIDKAEIKKLKGIDTLRTKSMKDLTHSEVETAVRGILGW